MCHSINFSCRSCGAALKGAGSHDGQCDRRSLANAVTAILLQAEVIRRRASNGMLDEYEAQIATDQIGLNAKRIWRVVDVEVFDPL